MAEMTVVREAARRRMQQRPPLIHAAAIRVLVVDDAPLVRQGLAMLLAQAGCAVVATAAGASEALGLVDSHEPVVVVVSARLRGVTGILLAAVLRKRRPSARVVLMSHDLTSERLLAAARAGVAAVLPRCADAAALFEVVARVANDETPIVDAFVAHWDVARTLLQLLYASEAGTPSAEVVIPTPCELVALDCLARGQDEQRTEGWIAPGLPSRRSHLNRLRVRHGLRNRTQLLRFAVERGWIGPVVPAFVRCPVSAVVTTKTMPQFGYD